MLQPKSTLFTMHSTLNENVNDSAKIRWIYCFYQKEETKNQII